ncbi:unnamed protein product [Trifolium pratense]|uniref:Uncharacterized protein n=1 Tax=Trifolium pratense TaxID=57577 RepID=A0ACB0JTV7_TRIPR|nr:unnamed protein product [Trifolium pratense]
MVLLMITMNSTVTDVPLPLVDWNMNTYDMPFLPDNSEICESDLEKALNVRGIEFFRPNQIFPERYFHLFRFAIKRHRN